MSRALRQVGEVINNFRILKLLPKEISAHRPYEIQCLSCGTVSVSLMPIIKRKSCKTCRYINGKVVNNFKIISQDNAPLIKNRRYSVECVQCGIKRDIVGSHNLGLRKCKGCRTVFPEASYAQLCRRFGVTRERMRQIISKHPELTYEYLMSVDLDVFKHLYQRKQVILPRCILEGVRSKDSYVRNRSRRLYSRFRYRTKKLVRIKE